MNVSMNFNDRIFLDLSFKVFCLLAAIASVSWCCYEYSKNEDMCEVYFKRFLEDDESEYPDLTIVLPQQLNETKLEKIFGKNMTSSRFRKILVGEDWDDRILNTQMEDVSLNLEDYMFSHCVWSSIYEPCEKLNHFIMFLDSGQIVIRFPPKKQVMFSTFQFSTTVFSNGLYPAQYEFLVAFQYPNRTFRAQGSYFDVHWMPNQNEVHENQQVTFALKNMEVLRRRDKGGKNCVNVENYDASIMENIYREVGCRPHYISSSLVDNICNTQDQLRNIAMKTGAAFHRLPSAENDVPPCTEIQKLQIDYSLKATAMTTLEAMGYSKEYPKQNGSWFEIKFDIQTDTFKEIKQKRAYSEQSLIGNLGGYLGIFIGFSLLDLFSAILSVRTKIFDSIFRLFGREQMYLAEHETTQNRVRSGNTKQNKCDSCKLRKVIAIRRSAYYRKASSHRNHTA